jgi:hypothetical protein
MFLYSEGSFDTNDSISETLLTSSFTGRTLTPLANEEISDAISFRVSSRRAVRMSLRSSGWVRANSRAVERPMPDEAPVIKTVLPLRRCAMLDDILARCAWAMLGRGVVLRGLRAALVKAVEVWAMRSKGRRRCMYVAMPSR